MKNMFRCGCTSDEQEPQHDSKDDGNSSSSSSAGDEKANKGEDKLQMESAKHYMERISKQLIASNEAIKKRNASQEQEQETIAAVFRMSTSSTITVNNTNRTTNGTINGTNARTTSHYPSLKHTDSESTQSTAAISEDELSYSQSSAEDDEEESSSPQDESQRQKPVSILRRKEKLGAIAASTGSAVKFCPTMVFPDPNALQKRKRVRRLPKAQQQQQQQYCYQPSQEEEKRNQLDITTIMSCQSYSYDDHSHHYQYSDDELRRLKRRAQQRHHGHYHPYTTHEMRSPSNDVLFPTESFYVFR